MKHPRQILYLLFTLLLAGNLPAAEPLRVFIRAGAKTHGPNQHDHPRFLTEWKQLLADRGLKVDGALDFPTAAQLESTDVLVVYAADGMKIVGEQRANFEKFLQKGGGLVVIHDGVVSGDQADWAKKVQGGAWRWDGEKKTKWLEGEVGLYFVDTSHPITRGLSNFDWKDEIYYDLDMAPDAQVLATSFENVFILAPQLWTYEHTWEGGQAPYRAFVSIPGHEFDSFKTPQYRAILLRGIAWAGKRSNADEFCRPEEIDPDVLRYPVGGPIRPDQAAAKLTLHPEFDLRLVASEPLVEKVISLDWAPDGKLWVAETPEYPGGRNINKNDAPIFPQRAKNSATANQEVRPARDRISWLEDSKGDGRMDRKHIFYEGLELVTSFVFYKDGVIVAQAPDILWLRDTDGDGKADKVVKLFTGFGTNDTHAVISNMRWGLDGWIYSAVGYSAGWPKSPDGSRDFGRVTAGIFRFKPDGSALEQVASGSCNTWGLDIAPDGEVFYTTATCGEHLLHIVMPEKVLARGNVGNLRASAVIPDHQKVFPLVQHKRQAYVQIDWVGMFTAAAGSCIYNGGAWPEKWNHTLFVHEPTVSLVHNDMLTPNGATYQARKETGREETEFFAGSDLWFRPIHSRVGPDGALYVVDWYNQAAVHNDTRGVPHGAHNAAARPDRDHHFARIWRVQHKEARRLPQLSLDEKNSAAWLDALHSENGWLRMTAHRLLTERGGQSEAAMLAQVASKTDSSPITRMHAIYLLANLGKVTDSVLNTSLRDQDAVVRKNALRVVAERNPSSRAPELSAIVPLLSDTDARVKLNAFIALASCTTQENAAAVAEAVVQAWPKLSDRYLQSAALGCAEQFPQVFLAAAFRAQDSAALSSLAGHLTRMIAQKQDPALSEALVVALAKEPARADELKQVSLETLTATLRPNVAVRWNDQLKSAFAALLKSSRPGLANAALPLVARWDTQGTLSSDSQSLIAALRGKLNDSSLSEEQRGSVIVNLVGVRTLDPQVVPQVASLLGSDLSVGLQRKIIEAFGAAREEGVGAQLVAAYPRVPVELRDPLFGQLVKRTEWSLALLQALAEKKIDLATLGPANTHRLRTHTDAAVAAKAGEVIDAIRGPQQKQKDAVIAQLRPVVEAPGGNTDTGHKLFTANCATCHAFKNEGRDLAPNLTGMGAHGAAELLVHIVDPNRQVEPNFYSTSIETRDGLSYDGVIARENKKEIVLRNASGDYTLPVENIAQRRLTTLSLMPEGFETLGGPGLRDLLAFLCAEDQLYRILDLSPAFTVNTAKGVYVTPDNPEDAPAFRKHGLVKACDVPFNIVSPQRAVANAVVLRGGSGFAKTLPQRAEAPAGLVATRLHFLGGIGGWAWPYGGESTKDIPVLKVTLHLAGGGSEDFTFRNGVEFADWIGSYDVPGSKAVPELAQRGQLRVFSHEVKSRAIIERISLESFDNSVAPTLIGITAELPKKEDKLSDNRSASAPAETAASGPGRKSGPRVLIVGAGSSHDFQRWFLDEDSRILSRAGLRVTSDQHPNEIEPLLKDIDVLYLSNNAPFTNAATRQAIMDFAKASKGLMLVHPALWYNWPDWPEYNQMLCGGGSRGHDHYDEFEVTVTEPNHPLMQGLPAKFTVKDELYWFEPDPKGAAIKVLATAYSPSKKKTFPMIFTVEHPQARIVGIALGHDGAVHEMPAWQRLLENAARWAAAKDSPRAPAR